MLSEMTKTNVEDCGGLAYSINGWIGGYQGQTGGLGVTEYGTLELRKGRKNSRFGFYQNRLDNVVTVQPGLNKASCPINMPDLVEWRT
jgi:hypothetical protein